MKDEGLGSEGWARLFEFLKFGQLTRHGEAWLWRGSSWQVGAGGHVRATNTVIRSGFLAFPTS
jgi:hypothetical protein